MNSNCYYNTNYIKPTLPKLVSDPTVVATAPTTKMSVKKHSTKKDDVPVFLQKVRLKFVALIARCCPASC
jgi:hypothetical protein